MKKIKYMFKAAVILGIVFAFVVPATAMTEKTQPTVTKITPYSKLFQILNLNAGWVEQASGFWVASRGIHYMHAVNDNVVWAVGYDGSGSNTPVQEFTRTTNGGDLWVADVIDGAPTGGDTAMIFALDDMTAWVPIHTGNPQGIWKTTDGGNTWARQTTADFTGGFPNTVYFWDENIGWCMGDPVGGYFEIYTTTDGGDNWVRVPSGNIPAPQSTVEYGVVGYYDVIGDTIWFGTQDGGIGGRVFKSTDRGENWTVSGVIFAPGSYVDIRFRDANNGVAMDKNFADAFLAETIDGGQNWATISYTGKCHGADFDYVPGTSNMYVSTGVQTGVPENNGATYSLDGGHSWTSWPDVEGIQLFGTTWVADKIGWAGNFNIDETTGGVYKYTPAENEPPTAPIIIGPPQAKKNKVLNYNFTSTDPDDDNIAEYVINWGDGTADETITGPFTSGETITASHKWAKNGDYIITAKAQDVNGAVGPTGSMSIKIPRTKTVYTPFLNFLENHLQIFLILKLVFHQFGL